MSKTLDLLGCPLLPKQGSNTQPDADLGRIYISGPASNLSQAGYIRFPAELREKKYRRVYFAAAPEGIYAMFNIENSFSHQIKRDDHKNLRVTKTGMTKSILDTWGVDYTEGTSVTFRAKHDEGQSLKYQVPVYLLEFVEVQKRSTNKKKLANKP